MQIEQISNRGIKQVVLNGKSTNTNGIIDVYFSNRSDFGEWYITEILDYIPNITLTNTLIFNMDQFTIFSNWFTTHLENEATNTDNVLQIRVRCYSKFSNQYCITMTGLSDTSPIPETIIAQTGYNSASITEPPELWKIIYYAEIPTDDLRGSSGTPTYIPLVTSQVPGTTNNTTIYLVSEDGEGSPKLALKTSDHLTYTNPPIIQEHGVASFLFTMYVLDYERTYGQLVNLTDLAEQIKQIKSNFVSL